MRRAAALALAAVALTGCGGSQPPPEIHVSGSLARRAADPGRYAKPLGAALRAEPAAGEAAYIRDFVTAFTSMTPENAMKWEFVEPERGRFDFRLADELVDAARRTHKRVRGHPLVWDQQLPGWLKDGDWDREELADVLRDHVRRLVGRYHGRVAEWDVVNEPFDEDGGWTESVWYRVLGEDYVDIAFRAAHEADPDARLFLNEVGAEHPGPRARALLRLARDLRRRGVPIDGVGFQNHTTVTGAPSRADLAATFRRYAALGLDVAITEMDVVIPPDGAPPDPLARQARAYEDAARACRDAANCTGLTVWGVTDRYSWKGADRQPLPFAADGRPKPALRALLDTLRG